jgi:hypothetical protein
VINFSDNASEIIKSLHAVSPLHCE